MNKSWKTTLFGLMAALGGALLAGIVTGFIDVTYLPKWLKGLAGICSVLGSAGLGFFARDKNVTSEQQGCAAPQVGAGAQVAAVAGLAALVALCFIMPTGCSTTPARLAYNVSTATDTGVTTALAAWDDYIVRSHPSLEQERKVQAAFSRYNAAQLAYVDACTLAFASGNTNSPTAGQASASAEVAAAVADLASLLQTFGIKL